MPASQNMEEWRKVEEYPTYSVSNLGNVRNDKTGRILKPGGNGWGYLLVGLSKNKKTTTQKVHRLVAVAFCEQPEGCTEVDHIDQHKTNNHYLNLRWVTRGHNQRNKRKRNGCSSQFPGVCFHKQNNKWEAGLKINGRSVYLGRFDTQEEAHAAWRQAVIDNHLEEFYPDFNNA